jgi:RecB family exonuclease
MTNTIIKKKTVSYSQIMMYHTCQHQWYLKYIKKKGTFEENIHLIFGSAMHTVMQNYLYVLYHKTSKEADMLDLEKMLYDELKKEFSRVVDKTSKYPASKEDMVEFYYDGVEILRWFKKHRGDYFGKKGYELIGCEIPLEVDLDGNVTFKGYIDIAIRDTVGHRVLIKDFKTSTRGWNQYQKKDEKKTQQMVLYKKMYSEQFGVPVENIEIEYIILKRKLFENTDYPQKRVQRFTPASGKPTINKVMNNVKEFLNNCFTDDGDYVDKTYYKNASNSNCKYCEFADKPELCDKINN